MESVGSHTCIKAGTILQSDNIPVVPELETLLLLRRSFDFPGPKVCGTFFPTGLYKGNTEMCSPKECTDNTYTVLQRCLYREQGGKAVRPMFPLDLRALPTLSPRESKAAKGSLCFQT